MDITKELFNKDLTFKLNHISKFKEKLKEKETKEAKIKATNDFYNPNISELEKVNIEPLSQKEFDNYTATVETLESYFSDCLEYFDTFVKMVNKGYFITVPALAEILNLKEGYITRFLMDEFTHFELPCEVRYVDKCYPDKRVALSKTLLEFEKIEKVRGSNWLNKKVFISLESVEKFIHDHIKLTDENVQVILNFTEKEKEKLLTKYKNENMLKSAITKALERIDDFKAREYFHKDLSGETINNIIFKEIELYSTPALKQVINTRHKEIKESTDNIKKSIADRQLYNFLRKTITSERFEFTGLKSEVKTKALVIRIENGKKTKAWEDIMETQDKIAVRYTANIESIDKAIANIENEYVYSISGACHRHLATLGKNVNTTLKKMVLKEI